MHTLLRKVKVAFFLNMYIICITDAFVRNLINAKFVRKFQCDYTRYSYQLKVTL